MRIVGTDEKIYTVPEPVFYALMRPLLSAEKSLESTGMGGIYATFNGLEDAVNQMSTHIRHLEQEKLNKETTLLEISKCVETLHAAWLSSDLEMVGICVRKLQALLNPPPQL